MPQRLKHDVDLETLPFIAFNTKVLRGKEGQKKPNFFVRHQSKLFLTLDTLLVTLSWRILLNPRYAIKKRQWMDLAFMTVHYGAAFILFKEEWWIYLIMIWGSKGYLFFHFALSHTHLPVTEEPRHWVEYCFYHTADIEPSWWCDWIMSYLNYQIVSKSIVEDFYVF
jgi:fatty acid desaturase 2 (delta-6 desaturase)